MAKKKLINSNEAAQIMAVSRGNLYHLIRQELIPVGVLVRLGRRLRFDLPTLEEWLAAGAPHPEEWRRHDQAAG